MPDRDPLEAARADRDYLLAHERWLGAEEVAGIMHVNLAGIELESWAAQMRRDKQMFGVRFREKYLYPELQFGLTGSLLPKLHELLSLLPITHGNWTAAFWLFQPHGRFGGRRPVDLFSENPDVVLNMAKEDFVEGLYEGEPVLSPKA